MFSQQIQRIRQKLDLLRYLDLNLKVFGADEHQYSLHPVLTREQIHQFQTLYGVALPEDYVAFITLLGDGGAGPFYGVHRLERSRINFFDPSGKAHHTYFDLSKPFPHTEQWNVAEQIEDIYSKIEAAYQAGDAELEEKLFEQKMDLVSGAEHDYGRLDTTDYGCGLQISLIVNGTEKGNMWTDDRTNEAGLYPSIELGNVKRITFLDWYELWLDNSLKEIQPMTQATH